MAQLPSWLPSLLAQINEALTVSPLLASLESDSEILEKGRTICIDLWPFIAMLPDSIASVRQALPAELEAALKLLDQLADGERQFQRLFIKQCHLAGLTEDDLSLHIPSAGAQQLCRVVGDYSLSGNYRDGLYAIVTAELAAAAFARAALPSYERFFGSHPKMYGKAQVDEGLSWLRLHAKPHTRHALWLRKMLMDIEAEDSQEMPLPAKVVLAAVCQFLRCPAAQPDAICLRSP